MKLTREEVEDCRRKMHGGYARSFTIDNALCNLALQALTAPAVTIQDEVGRFVLEAVEAEPDPLSHSPSHPPPGRKSRENPLRHRTNGPGSLALRGLRDGQQKLYAELQGVRLETCSSRTPPLPTIGATVKKKPSDTAERKRKVVGK